MIKIAVLAQTNCN